MARLLIHGIGHGKKTSRQLPKLKILIVWEGGGCGHIFSIILIADLQSLEDVFRGFALGGEVLNVGVNGGDGSNGGSGGYGGFRGFSVSDLLGAVISLGFSRCLEGLAFICAVSLLVASETKSFPNASSTVGGREFPKADGVDIHGIGIFGRT